MMTSRHVLALGTAGIAVAIASPAAAQPQMTYEGPSYEYAVPAPPAPPAAPPVIYQSQPVVQPIPAAPSYTYQSQAGADYEYEYETEEYAEPYRAPAYPAPHHPAPMAHDEYYAAPPQPAAFDRDAWLDQCRDNYRQNARRGDGGVGGGILGAAVGGVIGNRVADGDRLAGTLIGAGVGGLAGLAIGSAIDAATRKDDAREYCEAYLNQHMSGGYGHHYGAYPAGQYGYAQPQYGQAYYGQAYYPAPMMYVPVMVPVERRAVVRVYVEYVDEPVTVYEEVQVEEVVRHRVIEPAPATKTIPIKRAPQPTKYIKNN